MSSAASPAKKRHHYVPIAYLRRFAGADGRLRLYRKDDASTALRVTPQAALFRKYYYSQPMPDGGRDDHRLEDLFSEIEQDWPGLAQRLADRSHLSPEEVSRLFQFVALQRVRVPAARDMAEAMLAHQVMAEARALDAAGLLLPPPPEVPDIIEKIVVSIDPHMSIHAMTDMMRALAPTFDAIGLEVLQNQTQETFVTSDNPVIIFNSSVPEKQLQPYVLDPAMRSVELLFPIDPKTMLRGHSTLRSDFARRGVRHRPLKSANEVKRMNRLMARFAYEVLIASDDQHAALAQTYAGQSPVLGKAPNQPEGLGKGRLAMTFGPRTRKPRWTQN
jgi:hypothetical protein